MCSVTEGGQGRNSKEEPGSRDKSRDCAAVWLASTLTFKCLAFTSGPKGPVAACPQWVGPSHITQQSRNCPLNMLTGRMIEKKNLTWDSLFPGGSSWSQVEQNLTNTYHDLKSTGGSLGSLFLCVCMCVQMCECVSMYVCIFTYVGWRPTSRSFFRCYPLWIWGHDLSLGRGTLWVPQAHLSPPPQDWDLKYTTMPQFLT